MGDDVFEFEVPPEAAPQLVLGKKKKKKKSKKPDKSATSTEVENVQIPLPKEPQVGECATGSGESAPVKTGSEGRNADQNSDEDLSPAFAVLNTASSPTTADIPEYSAPQPELDSENGSGVPPNVASGTGPALQANVHAEDDLSEPSAESETLVPAESKRPMTAAEKKKAKKERERLAKMANAKIEQEDLDALLAEAPKYGDVDVPANGSTEDNISETVPLTAAQKKRAKKKKKAAAEKPEDSLDVALEELSTIEKDPTVVPDADQSDKGGVEDLLAEFGGAANIPAPKKKAKKKKKKGGKADEEGVEGAPDQDASAAAAEPKKTKKKESAAVRKMREQREKLLAEEEKLRKMREEEEARIAEEEREREEEAKRKEEEKARKKAAEKAKRERKRQEGTLLSKAEKERKRKAEIFRKQMMAQGMVPAARDPAAGQDSQSGTIYSGKRKINRRKGPAPSTESQEAKDAVSLSKDISVTENSIINAEPAKEEAKVQSEPDNAVIDVPEAWDDLPDGADQADISTTGLTDHTSDSLQEKYPADGPKKSSKMDESASKDSDDNDSDELDYEGASKGKIAGETRLQTLRRERVRQREEATAARSADVLRSPVICILGHVDTGKTKILDRIRRTNVQDGEAGGITQQIGATYFPIDAVKKEATKLLEGRKLQYKVPSLLIIDTPGHESFTNLRSRGSSLCDIAILVVDIMHGLEPQTRESINLLKERNAPFIVALNKVDRIYDWDAQPHNCPIRDSLAKQPRHAREEFNRRVNETKLEFAELGFNTELYWENKYISKTVSLVPTSAISGEGIPDLLMLLLALPQRLLVDRLMFSAILVATVLEVKVIEGLGTTIDIILTGGTIHEGDTIMVVGLDGPIVATIRALLTPHPMKEMRVKGQYLHHKEIRAAQGIKISADGLEKAVAGTQVMVVQDPNDDDEMQYVREEVMKDFHTILTNVDKSGLGVYVQASTLGSLEALLQFLRTSKIPVSGINIGPVHKRDVTKASTMLEKRKEFATVLAFDVIVEREARELAEETGVKIFTADIIYHLFDQFTAYMEQVKKERREEVNDDVVFPCICKILQQHVYNKKDPIVVGVDVMDGILRVGTPLVVKHGSEWLDVGRVASIELNKRQVVTARKGESVAVKIQSKTTEHIMYGRHFDYQDALISKMSRSAIELLKESFRDDLETEDWRLVVKLKTMFNIM